MNAISERRSLGTQGLTVSALGLGCMGMSEFYGAGSDEESIQVIHRALELGIDFFDTADMYGVGRNEELVGRALKSKRDEAIIATKFGNVRTPEGGFGPVNGKPEYVIQACNASLKRLGIDVIDLYYQHRVDPEVPIEDTVGAMKTLVEQGKVRFLGLSEAGVATIRRAHAVHPISALQSEYSLWYRELEETHWPTLRELGIGFVPYSPLGRGLLTGRFRSAQDLGGPGDYRANHPRFQGENLDKNVVLLERVEAIAAAKGATPSQIALAYVAAKGKDIVSIPGTKRLKYLEDNAQALSVGMTQADIEALENAMPTAETAGTRYVEGQLQRVNI